MAEKLDAPTTSSTDTGSSPKENNSTVGPKAIIKNVDMSEDMQQESVDIASAALEKYNIEKDIAAQIKKEFDRRHGPTWHVVVGKNFGSYVTHGRFSTFVLKPHTLLLLLRDFLSDAFLRVALSLILSFAPSDMSRPQKPNISSTSTSAPSPFSFGSHKLPSRHPRL
ncbi:hypothetical protein AcW1_007103 [Taiwanofungus camphoratus]|nr:hypothetical protein AcV5_005395 [Antrodia cinnamomea]KAI0925241.1 hypothetical protein AcW2_005914 [Antrodia cinnamomea]KAI0929561.1 hypothetical protein AcV7_005056 [Antrodia cinnamomea]KAI0955551.1 hypothetical protein AcW1_007103 [Antrodia cinnamomea]